VAATRTYRSDRRTDQARRTRQRILAAATAEFLAHGYAGTTIRAVAQRAGVSTPLVEATFQAKPRLLKAAIDVAIAGDDEPVAMLDREWTRLAGAARSADEFLRVVAGVLGSAQGRSAGLVLAALEGSARSADLAEITDQLVRQRLGTAAWLVENLGRYAPQPAGLTETEATDTLWVLMDPAVFDRLTRQRGWSVRRYQEWFARSAARLLTISPTDRPLEELPS
jgi:AcrR family transcriptional regulator